MEGNIGFYYSMYIVGFAIMMVFSLMLHRRLEVLKPQAVGFTLVTYVYGVLGAMIAGKIYTIVATMHGSQNGSRVAIYGALIFTPIFIFITARLIGAEPKRLLDMLAPGVLVVLLCAKFGCFMFGCCAGRESKWGIYNKGLGMTVFPVQIFEVATMLVILVLLMLYMYKAKSRPSGNAYFVMSAAYSFVRFFWEFFRYYDRPQLRQLALGCSFWQLTSIFVFIVSLSILAVLKFKQKKLN